MKRDIATLKSYFVTGAKPTQANFEDLIDSSFNEVDKSKGDIGRSLSDGAGWYRIATIAAKNCFGSFHGLLATDAGANSAVSIAFELAVNNASNQFIVKQLFAANSDTAKAYNAFDKIRYAYKAGSTTNPSYVEVHYSVSGANSAKLAATNAINVTFENFIKVGDNVDSGYTSTELSFQF